MFIIFGTENKSKTLGIKKEICECPRCKQQVFHNIVQQTGYFTLFWIPMLPYQNDYLEICPMCGYVVKKLYKKDAEDMVK